MNMFQVWGWLHDHREDQEQLQCEGRGSIFQQKLPWSCAEGAFTSSALLPLWLSSLHIYIAAGTTGQYLALTWIICSTCVWKHWLAGRIYNMRNISVELLKLIPLVLFHSVFFGNFVPSCSKFYPKKLMNLKVKSIGLHQVNQLHD